MVDRRRLLHSKIKAGLQNSDNPALAPVQPADENITVYGTLYAGDLGLTSGGGGGSTQPPPDPPSNFTVYAPLDKYDNFHIGAKKNNIGGDFNYGVTGSELNFTVWGHRAGGLTVNQAMAQPVAPTVEEQQVTVYAIAKNFEAAANLTMQLAAADAGVFQAHNGGGNVTTGFIDLFAAGTASIYATVLISAGGIGLARSAGTSLTAWKELAQGLSIIGATAKRPFENCH